MDSESYHLDMGFLYANFMNTKQIILITAVIFFAVLISTIVSIDMQENKEKAVLQERARLQVLEKEPLNKCLENAETVAESNEKYNIVLTYTVFSEAYRSCMQPTGHGVAQDALIASGKINLKEYCAPPTAQEVEMERQKIRKIEDSAKKECYRRYK